MADPVSSMKHITEMALKIKHAVETVQRNKEDCLQIRRRVMRVSILSLLQETENILSNPAISAARENGQKWERRRWHRHAVGASAVVAARGGSGGSRGGGERRPWQRAVGEAVASATTGNMGDGRSGGGVGPRREQRRRAAGAAVVVAARGR
uniref:Uncharacterized protein n=1 Tax=Oryza rufipogon TaxID=4529 RepID=A0A0E0P2W0_ORYRU